MKTLRRILAALPLALLSPHVLATTIQIDFTAILTSTVDHTGTIFRNGTADNSAAGVPISGHVMWDLDKPGLLGCSTQNCLYDYDIGGFEARPLSDSAIHWSLDVLGVEYNSALNYGSRNTVFLTDDQASGQPDNLSTGLHAYGHYQLTPENNGTFDYLSNEWSLGFSITDASGATINGLNFLQPIDWLSGLNGFGTGDFSIFSQLWEDGTAERWSGIPGAFLADGGGSFALTSLRSSQVPEPGPLALLAIGVVGMFVGRRRASKHPG